ncbi:winged helix-turn-helix domain-containing protein [Pleionea sp. CnH1-48]|uniref:winged helix-turn-helix domain-containing protein n=1 Tax=Pleionea sp. CnH1-48 TaxID=2954494 RepID=UPI00209831EC|nr:winged helix-turn-helix domain-containing protein [Pleionea sp. CnH1-48]MCO7224171.1 winged helix-turn-helix domain-containing protein [Pleionea sp. CnH1-48]
MSIYRFDTFQYDARRQELTESGTLRDIRPKALRLLAVFLQNPERVLSKQEIFMAVWNTEQVQDHTLFQVISEIRKLSSQPLIKTQPNLGYQWIAEVEEVSDTRQQPWWYAAAASVILAVSAFVWWPSADEETNFTHSLPALSAFAQGVMKLEQGRVQEASQWLEFALEENQQSSEARLLLAETLLLQQRLDDAIKVLQPLSNQPASPYHQMAAADLLSRIYVQKGQMPQALKAAIQGKDSLDWGQSQCTLDAVNQRIRELKQRMGIEPERSEAHQQQVASNQDYIKRCQQLLKAQQEDDLSDCNGSDKRHYLALREAQKNILKNKVAAV